MSANPQQMAQYTNWAPIKPLTELKRGGRKPDSRIAKALQELFTDKHRRDKLVFREMANVGQLVNLFLDGHQFLVASPYDGSWAVLPVRNSDQRCFNVLSNIKQNLLTKWEGSSPDIIIRAGRNLNQAQSAAKSADAINNFYERRFYDHWFTQQEGLMGMTFGTYIDRYRFDDSKLSLTLMSDIFEQKDVSLGDGYGQCGKCGFGGNPAQFAQGVCPECRSDEVRVERPESESLFSVSGQREDKHGDLTCELLPLPACRWDLAVRPEDSSWFMYRRRIPKGAVTRVLGNVLLPDGNTEHDNGLEVLGALHRQGAPIGGRSATGQRDDHDDKDRDSVVFDELWLSPDDYAHINLMGGEETVEGAEIPKGKLTDHFPDGLCAVGLNGLSTVLAIYPERHRNHLVSGTWFTRSQSGAGRGLADAVEIQKISNTMNNQAMTYMTSTYTPAIGYDNAIWTGNKAKYIGTPKTNIPFDLTKLPEGRSLKDAIYQFQPTAMPSQFFNFAQNFLGVIMQKVSMVTDFNNGEPGITGRNDTATAAEIDQGNADAINQPIFLIKADARRRGAEITINLFRQHFPMKRYFDLGGKFGRQQGIELSAADVQADLIFDVARNSEMPKGPYTRQKNLMSFFSVLGGAEGYVMLRTADPKLASEIEQVFDVDVETDDFDSVNELCLRRLGQMTEALETGVGDPAALISAIMPPISTVELELKEKAQWFARWLSTDDGQDSPMPLRAAAEMLAQGQFQGAITQQSQIAVGDGTVAAAQMAPAALGQAQLEAQAQQPESTEPDPTAMLQMEQELAQQKHESAESAADREHEMKVIEAEGRRDKEVAKVDATEKIRIEKAKPKPKPATKPAAKKK
jgi:hypothetical protein